MSKNIIPKTVHYCWFGNGEKSDLAKKCIIGWKEKLHDYNIIEWNESNFDITANKYIKEAYDNKKYAFVADYVRLFVLFNYGGIYMDTDVEVIKNFDTFLNQKAFIGFEDRELVSTALIGAQKGNVFIKEWLNTYDDRHFIENGKLNETTNVRVVTNTLLKLGMKQNNKLQKLYDSQITIYPIEYFSPLKFGTKNPKITKNTISIHWFEGTWLTVGKLLKIRFIIMAKNIIGFNNYNKIKNILKR